MEIISDPMEIIMEIISMRRLREHRKVRVVRLVQDSQAFSGTAGVSRAPAVGDVGVVVHAYPNGEAYTIEKSDDQGRTVWLADFLPEEIEAC